jgi:single-stranded-DNA-specific exonuclease
LLSGDGDALVGSARSIEGFSIFDALSSCEDLLLKFGGHDMAAGLSVAREKYDAFVSAITKYANENIKPEQLIKTVKPDVLATQKEIKYATAVEIEKMGPFGIGNPSPIVQFSKVRVDSVSTMGNGGAHMSLQIGTSNERIRCIWWNKGNYAPKLIRGMEIDVVAKIKVNEFRGRRTAELDLLDIALPSG